ncbi:MAG TPA: calcium/sodium antiporter [Verrucomicrobiales bacterium]|nr:calcium/sodium antiporter [Verrucomicrobiales bacterium]
MLFLAALIAGLACAGIGGELFVRAVVGLAAALRVAPAVIATTVAAFATSSPELSVAVSSSLAGEPEIALGDALGSNVVNIALILALALTFGSLHCNRDTIARDFPVALLIPIFTAVFCFDGQISRLDGILLLLMFIAWLTSILIHTGKRRATIAPGSMKTRRSALALALLTGLGLLVSAGILIVYGAKGIAELVGIHEFVIGATVVALGTSTPELATTLIARFRGHDDVGLGTILGSNIFNGLLIISVAAIIRPIPVELGRVATALIFGVVTVLLVYPSSRGFLDRKRGFLLLALYVAYAVTIWQRGA